MMNKRVVPLILSFIYCGLGQIYNRQIVKGIDFIIIYSLMLGTFFLPVSFWRLIGFSLFPTMWFIGMMDAYLGQDVSIRKRQFLLGILPGIFISILVFYVQYAQLLPDPAAPVSVPAIVPSEKPESFSVQVAAFRDLDKAQKLHEELLRKGYAARIKQSLTAEGQWFRVLIGEFDKPEDAAALAEKLREQKEFPDAAVYSDSLEQTEAEKNSPPPPNR